MSDSNSDSFADLFKAETTKKIKHLTPGTKVRATIVGMNAESTFLDVGGKSEGVINSSELKDPEGNFRFQVGDALDVYFLRAKASEQLFTISLGGGPGAAHLEDAFAAQIPVEGLVKGEIKGGFEITLGGNVRAFCPHSQIGLRRQPEGGAELIGNRLRFLVTRFEEGGRNIVVSARAVEEAERREKREQLVQTLREGETVSGTISSIRDFGAFVDLGGVDGLIPISEIGWTRVERIDEFFTLGQQVQVVVKKLDWDSDRISLSYKETLADPWQEGIANFPEGSIHRGKVARLAQFGAFVTLAPGIDGLLHISKLGSGRRLHHPREVVEVGQEVEVRIEGIDEKERRIALAPADYVAPERREEEDRAEFKAYVSSGKAKKSGDVGSLGLLLQKKIAEKKK
jgi:small subunit ribosomal protein S1